MFGGVLHWCFADWHEADTKPRSVQFFHLVAAAYLA